ncbi:hypothetical protein T310_10010 [Rasamsonia emersonii CBS 393.64]|uniref:Uncharacterized protein n=1 Tax=Rasamsonia emersonii (strain ATCC 16479 / CBS 393.64 / IMI 116815) TaxID=1408163 RepID=A0A0F4YFL2_RASE3|nr:hypothetical protein T310_10010 [Rasamsonia emersonii CBS 393.64]KKA16403.1 hypothetical protein T310_10010 [Rasamsonia emersonii CBS 393.64]
MMAQSFLCVMSLQTGASLITLSLLLNKISGLYGLLALLTGYHLSPVQLSMYIYSLAALGLTVFLFPHIRKQSPLQCLGLAWFYLLDTVINAAYTAAFGVSWFLVVSQHYHNAPTSGFGTDTIGETAGFTSPKYNVSSVQFSGNVLSDGEDTVVAAYPASAPAGSSGGRADGTPTLGNGVMQPESFESIVMIAALWLVRVYFVLVMFAFARQALRQQLLNASQPRYNKLPTHSRNTSIASAADIDRDPFLPHTPEGQGWQGVLGRAMTSVFRDYWLGPDSAEEEDFSWMNGFGRRFRKRSNLSLSGPAERERRRRSGTGPPQPSQAALQAASLQQPAYSQEPGMNVKLQDLSESR